MGDPGHLERMGRALKCPICLSLLNSAVSLTCNHVFCNPCIVKSMKMQSNCPVCKVPYCRREIRPAPHMDNLVNIYTSMEVASGINIFVTQNAPSTRLSDGEKQTAAHHSCGGQDNGGNCQDKAENQKTFEGKVSRKKCKPSFPNKKRVQVPQYPLSETPTQPKQVEGLFGGTAEDGLRSRLPTLKDKPVLNEKGEPIFLPFFWLREGEDAEKLSQHTEDDQLMNSLPPNAPSFSDIKDSDDENLSKLTPTGGVLGKSNIADFFDSEMFEWTQRPCSPELCSSPIKVQDAITDTVDGTEEKELKAASLSANTNEGPGIENAKFVNSKQETGSADVVFPNVSTPITKNSNDISGNSKSKKRCRKARERAQTKSAKRNKGQVLGICAGSKEESETLISCDNIGNFLNLEKSKRIKKAGSGSSTSKLTPKTVPDVSVGAETPNQEKNMITELPASSKRKEGSGKTGKKRKKIDSQYQKVCTLGPKNQRLDSAKIKVLKEGSTVQNQTKEDPIPQLSILSVPMADVKKPSNIWEKSSKHVREAKSAISSNCNSKFGCRKKLKVSPNVFSEESLVDDIQDGRSNVATKEIQAIEEAQGNPNVKINNSPTVEKHPLSNGVVLHKCSTLPNKIQCAFCLSSNDSEASGEMVHYRDGRPVDTDYNDRSKVIHSHKNCAEWAPNVYYEDDNAINLEAELARSRRIKCCCCGIKGAALGCYEKSCRKSFHVPCAKLIPQCRWDFDNFVMLCPLHASSKLPNEISGSQRTMKRISNTKRQSQAHLDQGVVKQDTGTSLNWNSCGSPDKLVLSCSALTIADRETISEFVRLSGVTVLKKWESKVTHVIASTDENGVCRRTLKILMGIMEGKWILTIEWVKACMNAMKHVDEEPYEITVDIHGIRDGPRRGRLRLLNKQPKLFDGLNFYFMGDFIPSYKGYLQDLVTVAGGTILHRKPVSGGHGALPSASSTPKTFIIYSLELPDKCDPCKKNMILNRRRSDAERLANSTETKVVSNTWILNSIAACKLQCLEEK